MVYHCTNCKKTMTKWRSVLAHYEKTLHNRMVRTHASNRAYNIDITPKGSTVTRLIKA